MSEFIDINDLMAKSEEELFNECTRRNLAESIPAPWDIYYDNGCWIIYDRKTQKNRIVIREHKGDVFEQIQATAHLVQSAPKLAARVIELEKERDEARRCAEEWRTAYRNKLEALGIEYADKHKHLMPWEQMKDGGSDE